MESGLKNTKYRPYFPGRSVVWKGGRGGFKLDVTLNWTKKSPYTFHLKNNDYEGFRDFVNRSIPTKFTVDEIELYQLLMGEFEFEV